MHQYYNLEERQRENKCLRAAPLLEVLCPGRYNLSIATKSIYRKGTKLSKYKCEESG